MSQDARDAVAARIAAIHAMIENQPPPVPGVVPLEVNGEWFDIQVVTGMPQAVVPRQQQSEWALVVDDWSLVVPHGAPRPAGSIAGCGIRFGDQLWPIPTAFELDRLASTSFPGLSNALLYCYLEHHGTPVGSLHYCLLFEDGVPRYAGDVPEPEPHMPKVGMGFSWPGTYRYRAGDAHQLEMLEGAWLDGNWKDLLSWHGLYDADGFRQIHRAYPALPDALLGYCNALAWIAQLPREDAVTDESPDAHAPAPEAP